MIEIKSFPKTLPIQGFLIHPGAVANVPVVDCSATDVVR
jgi:hypothetical protein